MPRVVYLAGWALVVVTGAFRLTDRVLHPPGVTAVNVQRLRPGMTLGWVRRRLGEHATDDEGDILVLSPGTRAVGYRWSGPQGDAVVWFGRSALVESVEWLPRQPSGPDGNE